MMIAFVSTVSLPRLQGKIETSAGVEESIDIRTTLFSEAYTFYRCHPRILLIKTHVSFAGTGPLNDVKSLGNLGLFSPQALSVSSSTTAGSDAPLTLDLGGNAFSGVWPAWLFYALVKAPAPIFVNLQVSHPLLSHDY